MVGPVWCARASFRRRLLAGVVPGLTGLLFGPLPAIAQELPAGGQVQHGVAAIGQAGPGRMVVEQSSQNAILSWQRFSIGQGGEVAFHNGSGATLNRVTGAVPSRIDGLLTATGSVYLVNPAGIAVGTTGRVATGGSFVAATHDITDSDFLDGGSLTFAGSSDATVVNAGRIGSSGGDVALIARRVVNQGSIEAPQGAAALAAGYEVLVSDAGQDGGRIAVRLGGTGTEVESDGAIDAAIAELRAQGGNVYALAGNAAGVIAATGIEERDGRIFLTAGEGSVTTGGRITALGAGAEGARPGGAIEVSGRTVSVAGDLSASGAGGAGGTVAVSGDLVVNTGTIRAGGTEGGSVHLDAGAILNAGVAAAGGSAGTAGQVRATARKSYVETHGGGLRADGVTGGGTIAVAAERVFSSGTIAATGRDGRGGEIRIEGADIDLAAARLDAGGATAGGTILLGGGLRGSGGLRHALTLDASSATTVRADAWQTGNGGMVVLWSDEATGFFGTASATGGPAGGDGGLIEISSKGDLAMGGRATADAPRGAAGSLLLDPRNILVSDDTGSFPQYDLIDPDPSANNGFGSQVIPLPSNTVVVTAPSQDTGGADAGAVYLYDENSGALLSALLGSAGGDSVGDSVTVLGNGNFVVSSPFWSGGLVDNAGAVTWGSGVTGISGVVSDANSLVGGKPDDFVGAFVTALSNGNYVVASPDWDSAIGTDNGAVTWGDGTNGTAGFVSEGNSLFGASDGDRVGLAPPVALANGNYAFASPEWTNPDMAAARAGAVTWGDGAGGTFGPVDTVNSLVGSTADDLVGSGGVTPLSNGNYVVASPEWDAGGTANVGAASWGNGSDGSTTGPVGLGSSLFGGTGDDRVGSGGVIPLTNGNYVVASPDWTNPNSGFARAGAATWADGGNFTAAAVDATNSLVGTFVDDLQGGSVTALENGHYVVASPLLDTAPGEIDRGAMTWGDGATGTFGAVGAGNSLIGGTDDDRVGSGGVVPLTNGNYVVLSPDWDDAGTTDAGAATWANGAGPALGTVSAASSLVGTAAFDQVGSGGATALTNGNYVVASPGWTDPDTGAGGAGAATWVDGTTGIVGPVPAATSLVGSEGDLVGSGGVVALPDGNYVVVSTGWNDGPNNPVGAVTWGDGAAGSNGLVSALNSMIGTDANDLFAAAGVFALSDSDYAIVSSGWDNGATANVGAITLVRGGAPATGFVTLQNSMTGSGANDQLGSRGVDEGDVTLVAGTTSGGLARVGLRDINADTGGLTFGRAEGQDFTLTSAALIEILDSGTDLALQASNDITIASDVLADELSGSSLTLEAGRMIIVTADLRVSGDLSLFANMPQAAGVIEADRVAGRGGIDVSAATLTSGGQVTLIVEDGAGRMEDASGAILLGSIDAAALEVSNFGLTADSDIRFSNAIQTLGDQVYTGDLFVDGADIDLQSLGGLVIWTTEGIGTISGGDGNAIRFTDFLGTTRIGVMDGDDAARLLAGPALAGRTYGEANPELLEVLLGAGALRPGDSIDALLTPGSAGLAWPFGEPTAASDAGDYFFELDSQTVTLEPGVQGYFFTVGVAPGVLSVTPRPIVVAATAGQSRSYGDANPDLSFTVGGAGLVNGDSLAGALAAAADARSDVGLYAITQGSLTASPNYMLAFTGEQFEVTPRPISVAATGQSRSYGDANPTLTFAVGGEGLVNGDSLAGALATAADSASGVGLYAITQGSLTASANYALTGFTGAQLAVTPRPLTVRAAAQSRPYGDTNPDLSFTVGGAGLVNGDSLAGALATAANTGSDVGLYAITQGNLAASANYMLAFTGEQLAVTPRPLTVEAVAQSRRYGDANPDLAFALGGAGLVNGDTLSGALATAADTASGVGLYDITQGNLAASANYDLAFTGADLTVTPRPLTVAALAQSRRYGDANPDLSFTLGGAGLVNGDSLNGALTAAADTASGVGLYAITQGNLAASANYRIAFTGAQLEVMKRPITVMAMAKRRPEGEANPPLTFMVLDAGLVNGDRLGGALAATADIDSAAGDYPILRGSLTEGSNYALSFVPATLTVQPAAGNGAAPAAPADKPADLSDSLDEVVVAPTIETNASEAATDSAHPACSS